MPGYFESLTQTVTQTAQGADGNNGDKSAKRRMRSNQTGPESARKRLLQSQTGIRVQEAVGSNPATRTKIPLKSNGFSGFLQLF